MSFACRARGDDFPTLNICKFLRQRESHGEKELTAYLAFYTRTCENVRWENEINAKPLLNEEKAI